MINPYIEYSLGKEHSFKSRAWLLLEELSAKGMFTELFQCLLKEDGVTIMSHYFILNVINLIFNIWYFLFLFVFLPLM